MRQWKEHGETEGLFLGDLTQPVVVAELDNEAGIHTLHSWSLPGVAHTGTYPNQEHAKLRAEQLLDLWLHRAGLEEV